MNGSHTYTQTALETVKVTLADDAPGTATATATSLILAVDPPPDHDARLAGGRTSGDAGKEYNARHNTLLWSQQK